MTNASHVVPAQIDLSPARAARLAYEDAVTTDGVSAATWARIALDMADTLKLMVAARCLTGLIESHRARAVDAAQRARYAQRMVVAARNYRVIDVATLQGGAS